MDENNDSKANTNNMNGTEQTKSDKSDAIVIDAES